MNTKHLLLTATAVTALSLLSAGTAAAAEPAPTQADSAKGAAIMAMPQAISPTLSGDIAFVVEGWALPANQTLQLNSTSLNTACTGGTSLGGDRVQTDRSGYFSFPAGAKGCVEGSYRIEATELQTPFKSYSTLVTVSAAAPGTGETVFVANPAKARANDSGDISFVMDGVSFPANTKVAVNAVALNAACKATSLKNVRVQADRDGRFTFAAAGRGCVPGTYAIEATQTQTPFTTYTTALTVAE